MNPTDPDSPPRPEPTGADGAVALTLATDPARPLPFDGAIRHPERLRAAFAAAIPDLGVAGSRVIATTAEDAWIVEAFDVASSVYASLSLAPDEFEGDVAAALGTTVAAFSPSAPLNCVRPGVSVRLQMRDSLGIPMRTPDAAGAWSHGLAMIQAALSLPMRRIPLDRGGLFALLGALGSARCVRESRSIEVRWAPGRPATAALGPGSPPVVLHAREEVDGPGGAVRVVVGGHLRRLARLLPVLDSVELFLLGPGLPSFWSTRLGGIRVLLGLPSWTADGRLGSLRLDALAPPVEPGRVLTGQVAATLRDGPARTRRQIVERTRAAEGAVAAVLARLAGLGQVLPEPATGLFRWRPAVVDPSAGSPHAEPAEVVAARAIVRTTAVQVTRDEPLPDGRGRRVEGTILDAPAWVELDPDGWLRRGRCSGCSHRRSRAGGPCRHLLALQAQVDAPGRPAPAQAPADLAGWLAGFPAANPV